MPQEKSTIEALERMIGEGNLLSAITTLKESGLPRGMVVEYTGKIARIIVVELSELSGRRKEEQARYLRSLLIMALDEVPELTRIYRSELRASL